MGVSGQRHDPAALLPPGKGPPVPIEGLLNMFGLEAIATGGKMNRWTHREVCPLDTKKTSSTVVFTAPPLAATYPVSRQWGVKSSGFLLLYKDSCGGHIFITGRVYTAVLEGKHREPPPPPEHEETTETRLTDWTQIYWHVIVSTAVLLLLYCFWTRHAVMTSRLQNG
jgi:hypothetical protein